MSASSRNEFPLWVFSFALFPLGLGGFVLGATDIWLGFQSSHWNVVEGRVLSSELVPTVWAPAQPLVRYSYKVDGSPYISTHIWPGHTFSHMPVLRQATSAQLAASYAAGRDVSVRVNPRDPGASALIPGPAKAVVWMGIFSFFLFVGFFSPMAIGQLFERWRRAKP